MFKKNTTKNTNSNENTNDNKKTSDNSLKSWLTGKLGSFILFTAVGYGLYKFGIINKITNYFTKKKEPKQEPLLG